VSHAVFSKRMQVYAYTCTSVVMVGLLLGVGWLYKIEKVQASDSVLMFILGQVLSAWVALTNKIFRITAPNIGTPDN
jgi:cytolysin (calcineurin-like family phosphatase)